MSVINTFLVHVEVYGKFFFNILKSEVIREFSRELANVVENCLKW